MVTPTAIRTNVQTLRLVHRVLSTYQLMTDLLQEVSLQHKSSTCLHHLLVLTTRPQSLFHLYTDIQLLPVPHSCKPQMRWLLPNRPLPHLGEVVFSYQIHHLKYLFRNHPNLMKFRPKIHLFFTTRRAMTINMTTTHRDQ